MWKWYCFIWNYPRYSKNCCFKEIHYYDSNVSKISVKVALLWVFMTFFRTVTLWNTCRELVLFILGLVTDLMSSSHIMKYERQPTKWFTFHEVDLSEERFSYGILVKNESVFDYFGSYCRDNQILIQACIFKGLAREEVILIFVLPLLRTLGGSLTFMNGLNLKYLFQHSFLKRNSWPNTFWNSFNWNGCLT